MKLCMSILADCLSEHSLQLFLHDDMHDITGVRFYADGLPEYTTGYVYIGHASDVFEDRHYKDAVLLASGHDMIIVDNESLETVVNEILMAFDRFNAWETALLEAALLEDNLQRMLDLSVDIFGGMLGIATLDGKIVAYRIVEEPGEHDIGWDYVIENRTIPITMTNTPIITADGETVPDLTSRPRLYELAGGRKYLSCYLEMDGERVAALYIQEKKKTFTEGDIKIAEVLCSAIRQSIAAKKHLGIRSQTSIFTDLLEGNPVDSASLGRLGTRQGSGTDFKEPWVVVVLKNIYVRNSIAQTHLVRTLQDLSVVNHAFGYGEDTVTIVSADDLASLIEEIESRTPLSRYVVGASMPFSSWDRLQSRYKQSLFAIEWNRGKTGVFYSQDHAFAYILQQIEQFNYDLELSHPALEQLRNYDEKNGTELYRTLIVFLNNERNVVATSHELFIHRNTLMSRIARIKILTGLEFDDPDERAYLTLSYLLNSRC